MNFAKKIFMLLIATSFIFTLYSCQAIIVGAYGIRDAKMMDVEAIAKLSDRIFNDSPYQYYVDSTFKNYLKSVGADASLSTCSVGESLIGDIKQPLKVYFFDRDRNFKNMFTNCKAGGFPNLNWSNAVADMNASDNLDSVRGKIVYNELSSYFMNLKSDAASVAEIDGPIVIVFWNKFMFRQSKRLVKFVAGRYGDTATIVYVNNDNFFYNAMFWNSEAAWNFKTDGLLLWLLTHMRHDNKLHFLKFDLKLASLQQSSIIDINPISEKVLIDNNDFNSIVYLDGDSKVVKARIFNR